MSDQPVIGVSCCLREREAETVHMVADRYLRAVMTYGGVTAVLIPAMPRLADIPALVARLDAVMLTGSPSNVHPRHYGEADGDGPFDEDRDEMVLRTVEAAVLLGKPVLGVCRGLQELNVALGGTLRRDLGEPGRPLAHHAPSGVAFDAMFAHRHEVALTPGGVLERALGAPALSVNSVHYQGIDGLAAGLDVEATAADGLVEAVSGRVQGTPLLAVQWHPEWRTAEDPAAQAIFALFGKLARGDRAPFGGQ